MDYLYLFHSFLGPQAPATAGGFGKWRHGALLLLLAGMATNAQAQQSASFFQADAAARSAAVTPLAKALRHAQALTLDAAGLQAALATAPVETQANKAPLVLALPLPDGSTGRFAVREASIMAPALAARFPAIKTYAGVGLDDASASVRLDVSPSGFHAQVLASEGRSFYIDPVSGADTRHYLSFYRRDMDRAAAGTSLACGFAPTAAQLEETAAKVALGTAAMRLQASGSQLRTYRLALANTPEYALTKGNTAAGVMAGKVTTMNRVVGVYEKELAVRMVLVSNNNQLDFLSGTGPQPPTPYDDNNTNNIILSQNQSNTDAIIGNPNYDIGHVFSTGGGGVAFLASVCNTTNKARGVTGLPNPTGDAFDIDYVAHEIGHQFGGNHPFNGDAGGCTGTNRVASRAWEPGSGSTIMAYAGICGSSNNLQPNSDATFHTGTYEEMRAFISSTACGVNTATSNTAPVVVAPASGFTLPVGTPFKLTATATDAEADALTYSWEELDLGPRQSPTGPQVAGQNVPLFRSFNPVASSTRFFPRLSDLVNNTTVLGERLPTVTRTMRFRCTARDQHSGPAGVIGGVDFSTLVTLNVNSTAGPFLVTAPNTAVSWTGGTTQTVTWDVANTNVTPVSCALVNIRLSLDGGLTYPTVLATNEVNDGSATVTAPSVGSTQSQARVMIEAADNYFFDISNASFTITPAPAPDLTVNSGTLASPTAVAAGTYNSITVTGNGVAQLAGSVVVNTAVAVQSGGVLLTNCQPLTGAATFSLAAGSTLGICDALGISSAAGQGAVQTTGTRSFSTDASYEYNGTTAQVTGNSLPAQVRNLTTTNANAVTLTAPVAVAQALTVGGAGNVVLNGQSLTLLSSAAGTALAVNTGTGIVQGGTATVQRFIASANTGLGYHHYAAPVSGSTVADLATAGFSPEISQGDAYNASATPSTVTPFPTVFAYDQARVALTNSFAPFDRGFVVPSASNPQIDLNLTVGRGYAVNIAGTQLVDFTGTLFTGDRSLTLARNAAGSANASEAGWQLVGNPYPAPIDYSLVAPANTGLENAMYVYESATQYTGSYRNYVNGVPATNRFVGTAQGFFVRVSSSQTSGTLNFRNSQRVTSFATQVPVLRGTADPRPLVELSLRGTTGPTDALYAYAEAGATTGFDPAYDARKLPNSTGLNLASLASTGESLSIDGRPVFAVGTVLPLTVGVPTAGTYTLTANALDNIPAGVDAFLTDAATSQTVNLRLQPAYAFSVTAAQSLALITGRFSLSFGARTALATTPLLANTAVVLYPNPAHDFFTVQIPAVSGASAVQVELLNALGQVVRQQAAALPSSGVSFAVKTAGLAAGVYTLHLTAGPASVVKRVVVE